MDELRRMQSMTEEYSPLASDDDRVLAVCRAHRERRLLKVWPDIVDALNISRSKAFEICSAGELRTVRIGRSVRVPVEEVDRYIESKLSGSESRDNGTPPAGASR
jgi:excisionase family DNA binding protein